jgi:hypothetical protein
MGGVAGGSGGPSGAESSGATAGSAGAGGAAAAAVPLVVAKAGWDRAKNSAENASDLARSSRVSPPGTTATVAEPPDTTDREVQ